MINCYINRHGTVDIPSKTKIIKKRISDNYVFYGDDPNIDYLKLGFEIFDYNELYDKDTIVFKRTYAIGDILMSIPVLRQMKEHYRIKNIVLEYGHNSNDKFILEQEMFPDLIITRDYHGKYDFIIDGENGLLEQDHRLELNRMLIPRFQLYQEYLGLPIIKELNFDFVEDRSNLLFDTNKDNVIALSLYSTTFQRSLNKGVIPYLIKYLNIIGYKVLLIDKIKETPEYDAIYANGKTTVQQAITNMKYCKAVITIDTGSLWFTHYAKVPTLCLSGTTAKEIKMTYHPLKNEGKAVGIDMRKYCGCKHDCGGFPVFCHGTAPCMNEFNYGILIKDIADKLSEIL